MDRSIVCTFDAFIFFILFVACLRRLRWYFKQWSRNFEFYSIVQRTPTFDLFGRYCTGELASRDEVALIFRAADLHVSASRMETVGFTVPWRGIALALMAESRRHKLKWYHVMWHITSHDCTCGTPELRIMLWTFAIESFCFKLLQTIVLTMYPTHKSFRQVGQLFCRGHGVY